jgi:signal transduction histidine kinase
LQSQRELLANVSHELRTPLARIRVALDLAAEGDADAARDAIANITTDWGDLERLVEDVLATARLDLGSSGAGAPPLRRDRVDLASMAEAVALRCGLVYPSETLQLDIDPALPLLEGDGALLKRVLDNLVDNARKYSDPGSQVTLVMTQEPAGLCLSVVDHGMGIDAADLPHIFTPFFRADRSRDRKTGGVGMGLALVRRIVEAHGGRIEVDSAVGKGTTMRVHLPLVPPQPPSSGRAQSRTRLEHKANADLTR